MGIFDFMRKKPEPEYIAFEHVPEWLDGYVENQEFSTTISVFRRELQSKLSRLMDILRELEHARLKDETVIHARAFSVFEGNRKSYVQKARAFVDDISVPQANEHILRFLESLSDKLSDLGEDTQKNFLIMREFVGDEARNAQRKLQELDQLIAQTRMQLETTTLPYVSEIRRIIREHHAGQQFIKSMHDAAQLVEDAKLELLDRRSRIDSKISSIKQTPGYAELESLRAKELSLRKVMDDMKQKAQHKASKVISLTKKYLRGEEPSLEGFLEDPVLSMMSEDYGRIQDRISDYMVRLRGADVDEKKKQKLIEELDEIENIDMQRLRRDISDAMDELAIIAKRMNNNPAHLNIKEQEGWLASLDKSIQIENQKLLEIEQKLERVNLNLIRQKIRDALKKLDGRLVMK